MKQFWIALHPRAQLTGSVALPPKLKEPLRKILDYVRGSKFYYLTRHVFGEHRGIAAV